MANGVSLAGVRIKEYHYATDGKVEVAFDTYEPVTVLDVRMHNGEIDDVRFQHIDEHSTRKQIFNYNSKGKFDDGTGREQA